MIHIYLLAYILLQSPWPAVLQLAAEAPTDAGIAAPVAVGTRTPPYDLLLQSDSRDAMTPCEVAPVEPAADPGGGGAAGVGGVGVGVGTAVGGGGAWPCVSSTVMFARTRAPAVLAVLGRLKEQTALDATALTTSAGAATGGGGGVGSVGVPSAAQTLTSLLSAAPSGLRWRLLPASNFPNGFVAFRRPLDASWSVTADTHPGTTVPASVVLLRADWTPGPATSRYLLREVGLWPLDGSSLSTSPPPPTRWLAYGADGDADAALHRQRGSLRAALMLAQLLKRTFVLPPFWRRTAHDGSSRPCTFAYLFDYETFAQASVVSE